MSDRSAPATVQTVGEQGILHLVRRFCPAVVVGDDGAVLALAPGQQLVVTTDVLIDGVHFSDQTTAPADVGWRAAAANLSDLAAMGAMPLGLTVGLGLPGDRPLTWVEALYQGLADCLAAYGGAIVGGDVVRSPVTTVAITAFGQVHPNQIIRRTTAQPRQAIVVTGVHGAARAGLELLLHPGCGAVLSDRDRQILIHAHQRPRPRLDVLPMLTELLGEQPPQPWAIAGMDSSDGLADAIIQLCQASGVGARIRYPALPLPPSFTPWLPPATALDWMLYGGEDFELVLCLEPELATELVHKLGQDAAIIGTTTVDPAIRLVELTALDSAPSTEAPLTLEQGFQHFSPAPPAAVD